MTIDPRSIAVIVVALVGCVSDMRTRRLPNTLTLGAAIIGVLVALLQNGVSGGVASVGGWLTAVLLFLPFFALGGMGAGDVKLLGALGAWLGAMDSLYLACFTALAGGVMALGVMVTHRYFGQAFRNLWLLLRFWLTAGPRPLPELTLEGSRGPKLPYAIPITVGALATIWLR